MAKGHDKFQFSVNGALHGTGDKVLDGSQIREIAGLEPASDFVLIQIEGGLARSISIEEQVKFASGEIAVFLSFTSDRTYNFTVNERGWEWGSPTILAADIYRYGEIDEELELILDSAGDAVIPSDGEVALDGAGVERIRSREPKMVTIKVNGRPRTVEKRPHSYREIAAIAYNNVLHDNSSEQAHFGRSGLNMLAYDPSHEDGALYLFDVSGRQSAHAQLLSDIPRLVSESGDVIGVADFYAGIYNSTPAHSEDIHQAIMENPDLQVITPAGGERRSANAIAVGDMLKLKQQKSFFPFFTSQEREQQK